MSDDKPDQDPAKNEKPDNKKPDNVIRAHFGNRAQREQAPRATIRYPSDLRPPANDGSFAIVMELCGSFIDENLFAAVPCQGGYNMLQFDCGVTAESMPTAKPVGRMVMMQSALDKYFEPTGQHCDRGLGKHFMRMAMKPENPGQAAALYRLKIDSVHVVEDAGLFAFGPVTLSYYERGDMIVRYAGGSISCAPRHEMAQRIKAVDEDAQIALGAALRDPQHQPPRGFDFT